jgi:hypothetical protein
MEPYSYLHIMSNQLPTAESLAAALRKLLRRFHISLRGITCLLTLPTLAWARLKALRRLIDKVAK